MILTKKQTKALDYLEDQTTTELLFGGGAGGGKSALGCYWQLKNRLKYPGTRGLIGRKKLTTLKDTTLKTFKDIARLQGLQQGTHYKITSSHDKENPNSVVFPNGSLIYLRDLFTYPSDPEFDNLGSLEITDAFVDEVNQISSKAKGVVKSRIRYRLDDFDLVPKFLGTCNPAKNWTYKDFYKPYRSGELPEYRKFIQSLLSDNRHVSKHYRQNLLTLDKASKERLLNGNWEYDDDPSALFEYEALTDLFTNTHAETGHYYIIADIARYGGDKTVIMVWDGNVVIDCKILKHSGIDETAEVIKNLKYKYQVRTSSILVDEDGIGGGVVDILKCKGFKNGSRPLKLNGVVENYDNLKSQCYFRASMNVNNALYWVKFDNPELKEKLVEELEVVQDKSYEKDSKKAVNKKDEMKAILGRSPDFGDCFMMREYFNLRKG